MISVTNLRSNFKTSQELRMLSSVTLKSILTRGGGSQFWNVKCQHVHKSSQAAAIKIMTYRHNCHNCQKISKLSDIVKMSKFSKIVNVFNNCSSVLFQPIACLVFQDQKLLTQLLCQWQVHLVCCRLDNFKLSDPWHLKFKIWIKFG